MCCSCQAGPWLGSVGDENGMSRGRLEAGRALLELELDDVSPSVQPEFVVEEFLLRRSISPQLSLIRGQGCKILEGEKVLFREHLFSCPAPFLLLLS